MWLHLRMGHADPQCIVGPGISSLFQQYKSDTERIRTWIGQTAIKHGFKRKRLNQYAVGPDDSLNAADGVKSVQGLQGALDNLSLASKGTVSCPKRYRITTAVHCELAEFIAQKAIVIPRDALLTLDRYIRARARCAKSIHKYGVADEGHDSFIGVLMRTRSLFEPLVPSSKPASKGASSARSFNSFKDLPDEICEDLADMQLPGTSPATEEIFVVEMSEDEARIRLFAFFEDVAAIRAHLRAVWASYRAGEINLMTASVVTNTALQLLEEPHKHVSRHILPTLGGLFAALTTLWEAVQGDFHAVPDKTAMSALPSHDQQWKTIDHLLLHDYLSLLDMAAICHRQRISCALSAPFIVTGNSTAGYTTLPVDHAQAMCDLADIVSIPEDEEDRVKRMQRCDRSAQLLCRALTPRASDDDPPKVVLMAMISQRIVLDTMHVMGTNRHLARNDLMRAIDRYQGKLVACFRPQSRPAGGTGHPWCDQGRRDLASRDRHHALEVRMLPRSETDESGAATRDVNALDLQCTYVRVSVGVHYHPVSGYGYASGQ